MTTQPNNEFLKECSRTYASIVIAGLTVDPDEITNRLNIEPHSICRIGEKPSPKSKRIYKQNTWCSYTSQDELDSKIAQDHLVFILDIFSPFQTDLIEFKQRGSNVYFSLFWEVYDRDAKQLGLRIDVETLTRISNLGADLLVDLYVD
jgi:hypothetical protein